MIVDYSFNAFKADKTITFDEESKTVGKKNTWYIAQGKAQGMDGEFVLTISNDGEFDPILEFNHGDETIKTMNVSIH